MTSTDPKLAVVRQVLAKAADDYWTPDRIRSAVPEERPRSGAAAPEGQRLGAAPPVKIEPSAQSSIPYMAIGRLLYTRGGVDLQATAFALGGKYGLVTAAHCLYKNGVWASNVRFESQQSAAGNAGVFPCTIGYALRGWIDANPLSGQLPGAHRYDVAMLTSLGKPGQNGMLVGTVDYTRTTGAYQVIGYPKGNLGGIDFSGNDLWSQDVFFSKIADGMLFAAPDGLPSGASGGPFVVVNDKDAWFHAIGDVSTRESNTVTTPCWSDNIENLLAAQTADAPTPKLPATTSSQLVGDGEPVNDTLSGDDVQPWYAGPDANSVQFQVTFQYDPLEEVFLTTMKATDPDFPAPGNWIGLDGNTLVHAQQPYEFFFMPNGPLAPGATSVIGCLAAGSKTTFVCIAPNGELVLGGSPTFWTIALT